MIFLNAAIPFVIPITLLMALTELCKIAIEQKSKDLFNLYTV